MQIREMTGTDYAACRALWLASPGMGLNDRDDSAEGFERFLRRNPGSCFVAVADAVLAASIMSGQDGRRGHIYHLAVAPAWQRRGIGSLLVQKVLEAMKVRMISKVSLVTFARNEAANSFWQKNGFNVRSDLVYLDIELARLERFDT